MIPQKLYDKIMKVFPTVSVEAAIMTKDGLLVTKRNNPPAKGLWWFPGGLIRKNETITHALKRKVIDETGLVLKTFQLVNVYERMFPERHDITLTFICTCEPGKIVLNSEHSAMDFLTPGEGGFLHDYMKQTLGDIRRHGYGQVPSH